MVDAIIQATAEVFAERGYARTTTNHIAERAGVSVGSLYQYFPNKDSLLARLLEKHHEDIHAILLVSLPRLADPSNPLEGELRGLVEALIQLHLEQPALTKALSSAVLHESPAAEHIHSDEELSQIEVVARALSARPDVRGGDHAAMALLLGQIVGHLTRWLSHDLPEAVDQALMIEETTQLLYRYLADDACLAGRSN